MPRKDLSKTVSESLVRTNRVAENRYPPLPPGSGQQAAPLDGLRPETPERLGLPKFAGDGTDGSLVLFPNTIGQDVQRTRESAVPARILKQPPVMLFLRRFRRLDVDEVDALQPVLETGEGNYGLIRLGPHEVRLARTRARKSRMSVWLARRAPLLVEIDVREVPRSIPT